MTKKATLMFGLLVAIGIGSHAVAQDEKISETDSSADAHSVMSEFWALTNSNRFDETGKLFAEDAVLIDPIWGRYEGRDQIEKFLSSFVGAGDGCCTLDRLVTDGNVGWGFWTLHGADGPQPWVGVYEITDGKISFYQDIHQRDYSDEEKAAHINASKAADNNED